MRASLILQRQRERARTLMGSRDPATAKAAKRALGATVLVLEALRTDGRVRLYVEAALRAAAILDALEQRGPRLANRRRAVRLAQYRAPPPRKFSDEELETAWQESDGNVRATARALQVAPSTVSRRVLRTVKARNASASHY